MTTQYILEPGSKTLSRRDIEDRPLEPDEVRVRMKAASLNYRDLITLDSRGVEAPLVPLSDGAGEVIETGSKVTSLQAGDRVVGLFFPTWLDGAIDAVKFTRARGGGTEHGMLSQTVTGTASSFLRFPDYLSFEEAATLPCAGLTAWNALFEHGGLRAGEVLVIQGTGGVALYALQLAKAAGARVIILSSSDEKLARARAMGADEGVNYRQMPDWEKAVLDLTNGVGADLILELGGGGTMAKSIAAVRIHGRISLVGVLTGFDSEINPLPILGKSLCVNGIYVGSAAMQKRFHAALAQNKIKPEIDKVFPFDQAPDSYAYQRSARHFGKIVISI
jgi:NADPH:quinone reductase-like Zn-dependent oxidoreductase